MIEDTAYYISSMLLVYGAATALIFVFPLFMWRNYLRDKPYIYRFLFCLVTQNCFLGCMVLALGILEICNVYTVILSLALEFMLVRWKYPGKARARRQKPRNAGVKVRRNTLYRLLRMLKRALHSTVRRVAEFKVPAAVREHWFILLLLAAAAIYNAAFLTHNVNISHCYQFSDIPVHQSWIYSLEHGTLFSAGIYPFGMHSVIYVIRVLTGHNLREVLLYFGSYQTVMLMLCVYCLAREMFKGRYIAFLPVIGFSMLLNNGRYAASLPQECGMFAVLTTGYFMLRMLKSERKPHNVPGDSRLRRALRVNQYFFRRYMTGDVCLLALSVACAISFHFYTAIAAAILVFALAAAYLPRMLKRQYLVPIAVSGALGVFIAVMPMGVCLVKGIPFQESMAWATSVIKGETWEGSGTDYLSILEKSKEVTAEEEAAEEEILPDDEQETAVVKENILVRLYNAVMHFGTDLIYGENSAKLMLACMAVSAFFCLAFLPFPSVRLMGAGYLAVSIYVMIIVIMGRAQELNIINIIAESRASVFVQPVLFILYAVPADVVYRLADCVDTKRVRLAATAMSLLTCAAVGVGIWKLDWVHNYFDVNLAYYNESEYVVRHIREEFPKDSFIVVSPTEEYYEVVDHGYHTELSEFVNMIDGGQAEFTFPSLYVFFMIEKKPLQDYYLGSVPIAAEYAREKFVYQASNQDYYFQRVILESKAYFWARECERTYPNTFSVYFENDIYVVYLLEQNVNYPYDLRFDYKAALPD